MNPSRRKFLAGAAGVSAVAASQSALAGVSPRSQSSTGEPTSSDSTADGHPVPVRITVAAREPLRIMHGGIGASFHITSATLPSARAEGGSWSGSAWGGNPEAGDDKHWQELFEHAEWLGMDWCRVELEQRTYEPEHRVFDWENSEMQVLYRILDWADRRGVDVFLQQMWANVAWNAYPENADDPIRRLRSAPYSVSEWAYGLGELVEHLTRVRKHTSIRWVSVSNEPGHDDFSWWQDSHMKALSITPGLKAAREEFDRRDLAMPISGPDWTDLPELNPAQVDFDPYVGAYDLHSYTAVFDSMTGPYKLADADQRMRQWAEWAHARNKPLFLSEFGTMGFGWGHDDVGPACYQSGLKNASLVVRGVNAGVDGFNRWSFTNRGDLDGQWQLVRTWDIDQKRLLDRFSPEPNAYYQFAMLARYFAKHSGVLATRVEAPFAHGDRKLVAATLRSPNGNLTILVVNESHHPANLAVDLENLPTAVRLHRYALTREAENKSYVELRPDRTLEASKEFTDHVPPMSIVVYSTYSLAAADPGIIAG